MAINEISLDLGRYTYVKKYSVVSAWIVSALLVISMGITISVHSEPAYVGYTMMAVILILSSTAIPIIEWFNSFHISKNMIVQLIITTCIFISFILIFWLEGFHHDLSLDSLALLFVFFMYPTFVVLLFAVVKWHDEKWVISTFVKGALGVCCVLITTFFIIVAIVYDPFEIGASLLVAFYIILFGSFIIPILNRKFPWLIKYAIIIGLCVLIAFAAGVGSQPNS